MHRPLTGLVNDLLAGSQDAISELVDMALGPLIVVARRSGATLEDAEEIALDVIFATLRNLQNLHFDEGTGRDPLFSYMAKAAKRGVQERYRARKRELAALARAANIDPPSSQQTLAETDQGKSIWSSPPVDPDSIDSEDIALVRVLMAELNDIDRLIAEFRSQTVLTWEEIAAELGIKSAAARKRWERVCRRFRNLHSGKEVQDVEPR